jgi:hypothetical protein
VLNYELWSDGLISMKGHMLGKRRTFRVKSSASVKWMTVDVGENGEGDVLNVSMTGLSMRVYKDINFALGTVLFIEPVDKLSTIIQNRKGKIVWFKKTSEGGIVKYLCGIQFIN